MKKNLKKILSMVMVVTILAALLTVNMGFVHAEVDSNGLSNDYWLTEDLSSAGGFQHVGTYAESRELIQRADYHGDWYDIELVTSVRLYKRTNTVDCYIKALSEPIPIGIEPYFSDFATYYFSQKQSVTQAVNRVNSKLANTDVSLATNFNNYNFNNLANGSSTHGIVTAQNGENTVTLTHLRRFSGDDVGWYTLQLRGSVREYKVEVVNLLNYYSVSEWQHYESGQWIIVPNLVGGYWVNESQYITTDTYVPVSYDTIYPIHRGETFTFRVVEGTNSNTMPYVSFRLTEEF